MIDFISRLNRYLLVYHQQLKNCNTKKEIVERNHAIISDFINSLEVYEKSNCEEENKMNNAKRKNMFEPKQIDEEFAKELLSELPIWSNEELRKYAKENNCEDVEEYLIYVLKDAGYIEKSRKDGIMREIQNIEVNICTKDYLKVIRLQKELITILDNQIKELRK